MKYVGETEKARQSELGRIASEYGLTGAQSKTKNQKKTKRGTSEIKFRKVIEPQENSNSARPIHTQV